MYRTFTTGLRLFALAMSIVSSMPSGAGAQGFTCAVTLGIAEPFLSIGRLEFELSYPSTDIVVVGKGTQVACSGLATELGGGLVPATFDDDDAGLVYGTFTSQAGFPGFTPLALCTVVAPLPTQTVDFSASAVLTQAPGGAVIEEQPEIQVTGVDCSVGTTTTTLLLSTTTTTLGPTTTTSLGATTTTTTTTTTSTTLSSGTTTTTTTPLPRPACGDPDDSGTLTASDSLFVLHVSIGLRVCALEVCDVDSSGSVLATDALRVLRAAVGLVETLNCPG